MFPQGPTVVVAGSTGDLGLRVTRALVSEGARVRGLVRRQSGAACVGAVRAAGATPVHVDFDDAPGLAEACRGAACVVSTLNGLRGVIVETQTRLADAAIAAGVPRFVPSDYALDFTTLRPGKNRNLDLRRELATRLETRDALAVTSILNGAFMELLTGPAPLVLRPLRRVLYWEDADQPLDFTAKDDVAAYTAKAALDPHAPRWLRIAGQTVTARQLTRLASEASGQTFRLLRGGSLGRLERMIAVTKRLTPRTEDPFPPWQGMQYLRDMFEGLGKLAPLDSDRYPGLAWTPIRALLANDAPRRAPVTGRVAEVVR